MRDLRRFLSLLPAIVLALTLAVCAQDEPSLGDVARQTRQQKQQKDAEDKPAAADPQNNVAQSKGPQSVDTNSGAQNKDAQNKDGQNKDGQNKEASGKDASANPPAPKTPHVITNEDISSPFGTTPQTAGTHASNAKSPAEGSENGKVPAETWRAQIQAQKNAIASLQAEITQLNDSIQFAPGNCVSGCVEWNERQKQKQDQVAAMKVQLEQLQQHLEEMQEAARQQGYGSSVYDP